VWDVTIARIVCRYTCIARLRGAILDKTEKQRLINNPDFDESVRNVNEQHTTQELVEHIRVLQAEVASRKSASQEDVYAVCHVADESREMFDDVVYALCTDGMSVTEVSTPTRAGFVTGSAKNWVAKAGGLRKFKELFSAPSLTAPQYHFRHEMPVRNTSVPEDICKAYLQARKDGGTGFSTTLTLVEAGTYEGNPFGIVQKPSGARWAIGDLTGNDKVQAYPMTRGAYRKVEKATKGQRSLCEIVVFDPLG
jgi:hypothetical protein